MKHLGAIVCALVVSATVAWVAVGAAHAADDPPTDHFRAGIVHFKNDAFREAAVEFEVARLSRPGHAPSHFYLGLARYKLGQAREALGHIRQARLIDPKLDGDLANLYLGLCFEELKLYFHARGAYQRVIAIDARSKVAELARARIDAIDATYAQAPATDVFRSYYVRGVKAFEAGALSEAIDQLAELHALYVAFPQARTAELARYRVFLAAAWNRLGSHGEALDVLETTPSDVAALELQRGIALLGIGRRAEAEQALARALSLEPGSTSAEAARRYLETLQRAPSEDARP